MKDLDEAERFTFRANKKNGGGGGGGAGGGGGSAGAGGKKGKHSLRGQNQRRKKGQEKGTAYADKLSSRVPGAHKRYSPF